MGAKPIVAVAAAAATLALPAAAADAAHPIRGTFLNKSRTNGVRVTTTRHTIQSISFFCVHTRWTLVRTIDIRRDGSFSFHGKLRQYGTEGQPWGEHKGRFSGRFTNRRHVRIKRKLAGRCGTRVVKAKGKRR